MVQICTRFGLEEAVTAACGADMHQIWPGEGVAAGCGADMHQIWPGGGVAAGYGADMHQIWLGEGSDSRMWCRFAPDLAWRRQ